MFGFGSEQGLQDQGWRGKSELVCGLTHASNGANSTINSANCTIDSINNSMIEVYSILLRRWAAAGCLSALFLPDEPLSQRQRTTMMPEKAGEASWKRTGRRSVLQ